MKIVIGINARNLPNVPGKVNKGINTTQVVAVEAIRGVLYSCSASSAAENGENQSFFFSAAHSSITIIVSIAIPNVTIMEKFTIKLSVVPIMENTMNVIPNAKGKERTEITDSLKLINNNTDKKTNINVDKALLKTVS